MLKAFNSVNKHVSQNFLGIVQGQLCKDSQLYYRSTRSFGLRQKQTEKGFSDEKGLRDDFNIPINSESKEAISYFEGHSLGLQPKLTTQYLAEFLDEWSNQGAEGWFSHWFDREKQLATLSADIVGAKPHEITYASTMTVNLHKMLSTFYKPHGNRKKILMFKDEFPSDEYAIKSHIKLRGEDVDECLLKVPINHFDSDIATQQIINAIEKHKESISVASLSVVNYLTSTRLQMDKITQACHKYDIKIIAQLAHAAGSIPLSLHDDDIDAAVWCSYKYLNSGPGCISGLYCHEKHASVEPGIQGWFGNDRNTMFQMRDTYKPEGDARRFQISTFDPCQHVRVLASLEMFHKAGGIKPVRERNIKLCNYLIEHLDGHSGLKVLSPVKEEERGSHLSFQLVGRDMAKIKNQLAEMNVFADLRRFEDDSYLIRIAPIGLYNTREELDKLITALKTHY